MTFQHDSQCERVKLVVEPIEVLAPREVLLGRLAEFAGEGEYFVLGDFEAAGPGVYSYAGVGPSDVITFEAGQSGDPLGLLEQAWLRCRFEDGVELPLPFAGGWVGYLSYDLGRYIERLPDGVAHDIDLPLLRFGFYDAVVGWDGRQERGYLMALEYGGQKSSVSERLGRLRKLCQSGGDGQAVTGDDGGRGLSVDELVERMDRNISEADYLGKVERAVEYIRAGDIFEVNLSQRFSRLYQGRGVELYEYLARHNPADYAGLLAWGGHNIVSASPELFLSRRGDRIVTRPIKGTTARGANGQADEVNRQRLVDSEKDRAELNMIIDLERNDLGRVCRYGSVELVEERAIEAHPTVFHAVATVAGRLADDVSVGEILRATFPGGSISGAPKIRAMEIIDELEPTARNVYTGSIGWIGLNGDMDLNIAIRTVILSGGRAYAQVGGAVVADSEAEAEHEETLAKAVALLRALEATG